LHINLKLKIILALQDKYFHIQ